jgi:3-oxoadipate enol-lactonase
VTGQVGWCDADGVRLRYALEGGGEVLLVNGLLMRLEAWDSFVAALGGVGVLRYDMRGQGESDDPLGPHGVAAHAGDLAALLRCVTLRHGVTPRWVVALSSGVPIALSALRGSGLRLLGFVAVSGFVRVDAQLRAVVGSWLAAHDVGGAEHRFDVATPWVWGASFLAERQGELAAWRAAAAASEGRRVRSLMAGVALWREGAEEGAEALQAPLLALHGELDVMTPARYGAALIAAAGGGVVDVVADAGHAAPLERPAAVVARIRAWREIGVSRW